jgi:hypothetical protein
VAKAQQVQANAQRETDTKVAFAALEDLLSASEMVFADIKGIIGSEKLSQARQYVKEGRGLPASKLEELQRGLAKLQAEGVLEGLKVAKAQIAANRRQYLEGPKAASAGKPPPTKRKRPDLSKPGGGGPPAPLTKRSRQALVPAPAAAALGAEADVGYRLRFQVTFKKRTQSLEIASGFGPRWFAGAAQLVNTVPIKHLLRLQEESSYAAGWLLPAPAGSERCMVTELQRYLKKHGQVGATQSCDVLVLPDELVCHVTSGMLVQPPGSICVLSCL